MAQENPRQRKRTRMVRPYPIHTLEDALDIALTIQEANAGLPFDRKLLANALGTTPASSGYTMRLNSSAKYGLTQGGYSDERISLTPRGEAIVAPKGDTERQRSMVEAALQPDLFRRFYEMLDGKQLPEDTYARNVLQRDLGIHPELTGESLEIIKANGLHVGILTQSNGGLIINLSGSNYGTEQDVSPEMQPEIRTSQQADQSVPTQEAVRQGKVFLGYCHDSDEAKFIKSTLEQFGIPYNGPDLTKDKSRPISEGTAEVMRESSAAILVIGSGSQLDGDESKECLDRNMYLIGAASVLYGDKIILFIEKGQNMAFDPKATRCVEYKKGRHAESGLALLGELHTSGIISVGV